MNDKPPLQATLEFSLTISQVRPIMFRVCAKKNSQKTGIFYKIRNYLSKKSLVSLYYSFVYPHLLYGILTWGSACKSIIKTLQVIGNKILRIISKVTHESAVKNDFLFHSLNILKIRDIYKLELAKFMYKYHSQMLPNTFEKCLNSIATTQWSCKKKTVVTACFPTILHFSLVVLSNVGLQRKS